MLDFIVERREMRDVLIRCLKFMYNTEALAASAPSAATAPVSTAGSGTAPGVAATGSGSVASGQPGRTREPLPFPTPMVARTKITPSPEIS